MNKITIIWSLILIHELRLNQLMLRCTTRYRHSNTTCRKCIPSSYYNPTHHNIPLSSRGRAIFTFSEFGAQQASTDDKCHFAISWASLCQHQCICKISSQYSTQFKRWGHFHFFRIWSSAKPRPMINVISQSLGLACVNINVYAKFHHDIPLSSRDGAIFTFSVFGAQQASTDDKCHYANSRARSCQYQCVCKISS